MAAPFGGHPSFQEYLIWAREEDCTVQAGVLYTSDGRARSVTRIIAPSGRTVIEVGTQHGDILVPTTVNRLDRRLGIKSPFFSLPEMGEK